MPDRLDFGAIWLPIHVETHNPALQLEHELQLAEHMDRLGFDEVWFGEHHSGGWEIGGAPEMMIAAAAQRTKNLRFGTGVSSLPYHHPLMLLDRILMLDNMTRGRVMFGMGPGSLPRDARMMGIDILEARRMMEESLDAMVELLEYSGPVSRKTDWFTLAEAELQWRPYGDELDLRVAQAISPSGPRLAGRYGTGMLSVAAASPEGFAALQNAWSIVEERSARFGTQVSRKKWAIGAFIHIADTEAEARAEVRYGLQDWVRYMQVASFFRLDDTLSVDEQIDYLVDNGLAVIGTADMAIDKIEAFQQQTGGFGSLLLFGHDWANITNTRKSYEIFAQKVMPHFRGHLDARKQAWNRTLEETARGLGVSEWEAAAAKASKQHEDEKVSAR
ncbi:LLM class flavin-dependent oxidoreductase [Rhodococcus koreensis]|uniref:LLM class flavin-dependent oxidoreductase n=1 Tax=Rhodococcus koreensis TaxID=99653 RepID=UPI00366BB9CA